MLEIINAKPASGSLGKIITLLDTSVRYVCAVVIWLCFCTVFFPTLANAVLRYTTDASITWSSEIVPLTFPWFIMAGAVLAAQHSQHIRIDFILKFLPAKFRVMMLILVELLIITTSLTVIYVYLGFGEFDGGIKFAAGDSMYTSLGVSQSLSYLAILLGYIGLTVTSMTCIYRILTHSDNENIKVSL